MNVMNKRIYAIVKSLLKKIKVKAPNMNKIYIN